MAGKLEIFEINDDFVIFVERLETWFSVNGIKAEQKANYLLTSLSASVYKLLRNALAPKALSEENFADLITALNSQFVRKTIVFKERRRFYEAKQMSGEKSLDFFNRLKALAINCNFDKQIDAILLDKFIAGLVLGLTFDRICEENTITIEKCIEIAQSKELDGDVECHKMANDRNANKKKSFSTNSSDAKCNACGKGGHIFKTCKYKQYKCKICKKVGHLAVVCKTSKAPSRNHLMEQDQQPEGESDESLQLFSIDYLCNFSCNFSKKPDVYWTTLSVNGCEIKFEIDTGSAISAIPYKVYAEKFSNHKLNPCLDGLRSYNGGIIDTCGFVNMTVASSGECFFCRLYCD